MHWRASSRFPGHHRSAHSGPGLEFTGHAPLLAAPDPRRLDVRASLSDPFEQWLVRTYRQRSSLPVYLLADVSASMACKGRKLRALVDFASALAYSAYRTGDRFGFVACDERPRSDLFLVPGRHRGAGAEIRRRIEASTFSGRNALGLAAAPALLGKQRALVFLVSDFHFPVAFLHRVLHALARHDVVPVVLWDPEEQELYEQSGFGLRVVRDSESGRHRYLFMRPALRLKLAQASLERKQALTQAFMAHSLQPLAITGEFSADAVTRYFFPDYALAQAGRK